ncbi:MAG: PD40 domain-containing protein [Bacteroidales bacterium]|nr:MAG: PD40 domain-containing protein [Bacteroidales bacterium]
MRIIVLILILCWFVCPGIYSQQEIKTDSKKAINAYNQGIRKYTLHNYAEAIDFLKQAIEADRNFINAWFVLAEVFTDDNQYENAISAYKKGMAINPMYYPRGYIRQGKLEFSLGRYEDSKESYSRYLELNTQNEKQNNLAKKGIKYCEFAIHAVNNPVDFQPENLGPGINTIEDEYWPSLSADGQTLIITRLVKRSVVYGGMQEDFFISHKDQDGWSMMKNAGYPLNTEDNEGAQTISADGRFMVFTACNRNDGVGRCDLYYSEKAGGKWSYPKNMQTPVNTRYKETQPSLSADGRTLYFASDRPGGKGQLDIWVTFKDEENNWTKPVNLGDTINTRQHEMSPFIHFDNQTLYFASEGYPGLGGFDLYVSRKDSTEYWTKPENLGYPINTSQDEIGLIVNSKGNKAYYSSGRDPNYGKDIYMFELYEEAQPLEVSYMKGKVFDIETKDRLKARFELIDLETAKMIYEADSDEETGEFLVCLPANKDYCLNVSKKGYLFFSENFAFKGTFKSTEPFLKDVPLQPIKIGESIILKNIFYKTDSFTLMKESKVELDKVIKFLNDYPDIKIEISGHTDNTGTAEYNQTLSENRAKSVVNYLIGSSVLKERIKYKGYGFLKPVASNNTEEGRAQNRRTELKIIDN